jgi:predicted PurR-regulated permease PerM
MTPEPPGEPPEGSKPSDPGLPGITAPMSPRARATTWLGEGGAPRRFLTRWGFPLFVLVILILGRAVLLPFIFAALIAYILAPVVAWMCDRKDGTQRMPRGLAIIICYIVFIAVVVGFLFLLVPRLSGDFARLGKEVPGLLKKINEERIPELARWLEQKFPSLAQKPNTDENGARASDVPLPPYTAFTVTPMPDGRLAIQLAPSGIDMKPLPDGGIHLQAQEAPPEPQSLEDKMRAYVKKALLSLQSQLEGLVRFGQSLVAGFIKGIFMFFFTLMIAAFILIDLEKVHSFLRSLFPANVREDYDIIKAGIDRGLSGVIRGQLVICVINGILTYVGLVIFGVKYGLILAVVAGLMSLIPIFGSILSSIPIVAVALVSGESGIDIVRGIAITLWIVGIHFIEANLLNPKIIGTAAKIHPVLVIFSLFLGEHSYGLVGALLAVPILSAIQVVFMYFYRKTWKEPARAAVAGGGGPERASGPIKKSESSQPLPPTKS